MTGVTEGRWMEEQLSSKFPIKSKYNINISFLGFSKLEGTKVERVVSLIRALGLDLGGLVGDVETHFHQPRFNIQTKGSSIIDCF